MRCYDALAKVIYMCFMTFPASATGCRLPQRTRGLARVLLSVLALPLSGGATEYWVNNTNAASSDTNAGTLLAPWLTIQHAANIAKAGDLVHIQGPSIYDERFAVAKDGSAGSLLTFKGEDAPKVRGVDLTSRNFVRVVGFEITHPPSGCAYPALCLSAANFNQILDCNIHDVNSWGVRIGGGTTAGNSNVIRSNRVFNVGYVNGTNFNSNAAIYCMGTNNLIEYNVLGRCSDFVAGDRAAYRNVVRNNYLCDIQTNYFGGATPHVDCWESQPVDTNQINSVYQNIFERNYCISNYVADGHGVLLQSPTYSTNDSGVNTGGFIYRLNAESQFGSFVGVIDGYPLVKWYNNVFDHFNQLNAKGNAFNATAGFDKGATNCSALNNIYYSCGSASSYTYGPDASTANTFVNDGDCAFLGCWLSPREIHGMTNDPAFVSERAGDFHLQATSQCIGMGVPQTSATSSGANTNVVQVGDATFFCDGWGISGVTGDSIVISGNTALTTTNIDYANNLIYFPNNLTWTNNAPVYLDGTQDIGAYPYRSGGYNYDVALANPTNGAAVSGPVILAASVTNPAVVRFVKFYVDGLEVGTATAPPYTISWTSDSSAHTIQARAYALYADSKLAAVSSVTVNNGGAGAPGKDPGAVIPPSNLIVQP